MFSLIRLAIFGIVCLLPGFLYAQPPEVGDAGADASDLNAKQVREAIDRGKAFLSRKQNADGSWTLDQANFNDPGVYRVGITSLSLLALINSGMTLDNREVRDGLKFLRKQNPTGRFETYESSLMIMALAAAKDGAHDRPRIERLVRKLEKIQIRGGENSGLWSYSSEGGSGDPSNGQFAILGLREAQEAGVPVKLETWQLARDYWIRSQARDGSWNYPPIPGTGSMTVAGMSSLIITEGMVRASEEEINADGTPRCCDDRKPDKEVQAGASWLGRHFSVQNNPNGSWLMYYLYGLERAGRLSARRFFGDAPNRHDWYREGARHLVARQQVKDGSWTGVGALEGQETVLASSFALLFLSKGLAPVLINKLQYGGGAGAGDDPRAKGAWNRHPDDVRNLTQLISGLPKWPKLLTWQIVEIDNSQLTDLLQAPVLFLNGSEPLKLTPPQVSLLRDYVAQGGFIFAERACSGTAFEESFKELIRQMYPAGDVKLAPLTADHPLYRSEYLIDAASTPLWGADVGCRTSIVYSANDYSCLWDKWTSFAVPKRSPQTAAMITKATNVGVNVIAYATGREPANKLEAPSVMVNDGHQDKVERGRLQIAKMRHSGDWNAAPMALRNLLAALNKTVGLAATTKVRELAITDPNVSKYPILYLHGRQTFLLSQQEREHLRKALERQAILVADACCGSKLFDRSFREEMAQLFPNHKLKRIPPTHELFKADMGGHELLRVKRRETEINQPDAPLNIVVREGEPILEGIEIDGRYAVIYSPYDISCALERHNAVTCNGYVQEDAIKLAVNIILYAMQQ